MSWTRVTCGQAAKRITITALGGRRPLIQVEPKMSNEIIVHWVDRY